MKKIILLAALSSVLAIQAGKGNYTFGCTTQECSRRFRTEAGLKTHIHKAHTNPSPTQRKVAQPDRGGPFKCLHCGKGWLSAQTLQAHSRQAAICRNRLTTKEKRSKALGLKKAPNQQIAVAQGKYSFEDLVKAASIARNELHKENNQKSSESNKENQ